MLIYQKTALSQFTASALTLSPKKTFLRLHPPESYQIHIRNWYSAKRAKQAAKRLALLLLLLLLLLLIYANWHNKHAHKIHTKMHSYEKC